MKKYVLSVMLTLSVLCSLMVPAFAAAPQEPVAPMDNLITVQTKTLSAGQEGARAGTEFIGVSKLGSYYPTRTLQLYTNLSTTGSGRTVLMGLATYDAINGTYGQAVGLNQAKYVSLKTSVYLNPTLDNGKTYYTYMYNATGGTVTGTLTWYRVDGLS